MKANKNQTVLDELEDNADTPQVRAIGVFFNESDCFPAGCWIALHRRRDSEEKDAIRFYSPTTPSWQRLRNVINATGKMHLTPSAIEWEPHLT